MYSTVLTEEKFEESQIRSPEAMRRISMTLFYLFIWFWFIFSFWFQLYPQAQTSWRPRKKAVPAVTRLRHVWSVMAPKGHSVPLPWFINGGEETNQEHCGSFSWEPWPLTSISNTPVGDNTRERGAAESQKLKVRACVVMLAAKRGTSPLCS